MIAHSYCNTYLLGANIWFAINILQKQMPTHFITDVWFYRRCLVADAFWGVDG